METFYLVWMMEFLHCKYRQPFNPTYTFCGADWKDIYFAPSLNVNKNYTINTTNKVEIFITDCSWSDSSCGSRGPQPISFNEAVIIYRVSEFESWSLTLSCAAQTRDHRFELARGKDMGEITKYRDWVCEKWNTAFQNNAVTCHFIALYVRAYCKFIKFPLRIFICKEIWIGPILSIWSS